MSASIHCWSQSPFQLQITASVRERLLLAIWARAHFANSIRLRTDAVTFNWIGLYQEQLSKLFHRKTTWLQLFAHYICLKKSSNIFWCFILNGSVSYFLNFFALLRYCISQQYLINQCLLCDNYPLKVLGM